MPVGNVRGQRAGGSLGIAPGLGGQHFDALGQQDRGLALHLDAVLKILDALDAIGQLGLQGSQGFAAERSARLGGVALPGHGVGDIEFAQGEQRPGLFGPFGGDRLLAPAALDLIELFAKQFGRALVAPAQLAEHLLHLLQAGIGRKPLAHARGAFARSGRRECAAGERVEGAGVVGFQGGLGH